MPALRCGSIRHTSVQGTIGKVEIEKAIRTSKVFTTCLSSRSVNKRGFVQAELQRALDCSIRFLRAMFILSLFVSMNAKFRIGFVVYTVSARSRKVIN